MTYSCFPPCPEHQVQNLDCMDCFAKKEPRPKRDDSFNPIYVICEWESCVRCMPELELQEQRDGRPFCPMFAVHVCPQGDERAKACTKVAESLRGAFRRMRLIQAYLSRPLQCDHMEKSQAGEGVNDGHDRQS